MPHVRRAAAGCRPSDALLSGCRPAATPLRGCQQSDVLVTFAEAAQEVMLPAEGLVQSVAAAQPDKGMFEYYMSNVKVCFFVLFVCFCFVGLKFFQLTDHCRALGCRVGE